MPIPQSLPAKRRFWKSHVESWRKSGLPQARYARQNGIHPRTFLDWCRKIPPMNIAPVTEGRLVRAFQNPEPTGVEFVSVPVTVLSAVDRPPAPCGSLAINLGRRFQIVVPQEFSSSLLVKVVQTLEGIR